MSRTMTVICRPDQRAIRAALAVNRELVSLYWQIDRQILVRQEAERWETRAIDRLAADLRRVPGDDRLLTDEPQVHEIARRGLSLKQIGQQAVGRIPQGQDSVLLTQLDDHAERLWSAARMVEHGWSRAVLIAPTTAAQNARESGSVRNNRRGSP